MPECWIFELCSAATVARPDDVYFFRDESVTALQVWYAGRFPFLSNFQKRESAERGCSRPCQALQSIDRPQQAWSTPKLEQ